MLRANKKSKVIKGLSWLERAGVARLARASIAIIVGGVLDGTVTVTIKEPIVRALHEVAFNWSEIPRNKNQSTIQTPQ